MEVNYKKLFGKLMRVIVTLTIIKLIMDVIIYIISGFTGVIPYFNFIIKTVYIGTALIYIYLLGYIPNIYYGIKYRKILNKALIVGLLFQPYFGFVLKGSIE